MPKVECPVRTHAHENECRIHFTNFVGNLLVQMHVGRRFSIEELDTHLRDAVIACLAMTSLDEIPRKYFAQWCELREHSIAYSSAVDDVLEDWKYFHKSDLADSGLIPRNYPKSGPSHPIRRR